MCAFLLWCPADYWGSPGGKIDKDLPANAGDIRDARDTGSIPGLVRSLGRGHFNQLQYSCLENPVDSGAQPMGSQESDTAEWLTLHRLLLIQGPTQFLHIFPRSFFYYNVIQGGIWSRGSKTFVYPLIAVLGSFSWSLLLLLLPHISLSCSFCYWAAAFKGTWPWFTFILEDKDTAISKCYPWGYDWEV